MSNWIGQTGPWLAGFSAWNLIQLKSRSCWAWFFSGTWGCGGAGPCFEITWFLTEFSCLQIQDRGPFFVPDTRWESRLSLRGCPQFFAMWLPFPKAVHKMTFWFFFLCPQNAFLSDFSFNSSQLQESYLMGCDHRSDTLRPFPLYHNTHTHLLSCVQLFADPWAAALQAPLSLEFSRQEYWSGLPFPPPGVRPHPSQGLN